MTNLIKSLGHSISKGSKSITHVFTSGGKKIEGAVHDVYHDSKKAVSGVYNDAKSAVSYTGKHLVNDVDNVSNILSGPILYIGAGILAVFLISQRR